MERAHHSSSAGCSSARCTDAHRSASSASRRAPQIAWQVLLSLFYLWCADAFGRSWTGRAPVVHGSTSARAARDIGKLALNLRKLPCNFRPEAGSFRKSGGTLGLPCALHCAFKASFPVASNLVVSAHFPSGEPALHLGKSADTLLGLLLSESITRTHTPSWMRAFAVYRILTTQYQPFFQPILTFVRCLSHRYRPLQQWFCVAAHPTVLVSLIGRSFWWVMHHQRPFAVAANLALSAHNQLGECASTEVCLHLDQADTLPVFQGQGLFRALVRLCLRCHRDATLITLCVAADNTAAQAAYKNVGFGWRETVEGVHTYALSGRNLAQLRSSKCLLSEATPPGLQFTRLTRSPLLPEEGERGVGAELYLNDLTMRHALPMQL